MKVGVTETGLVTIPPGLEGDEEHGFIEHAVRSVLRQRQVEAFVRMVQVGQLREAMPRDFFRKRQTTEAEWWRAELGVSKSWVSKCRIVYRAFGGDDPESFRDVPVESLYIAACMVRDGKPKEEVLSLAQTLKVGTLRKERRLQRGAAEVDAKRARAEASRLRGRYGKSDTLLLVRLLRDLVQGEDLAVYQEPFRLRRKYNNDELEVLIGELGDRKA